MKKKIEEMSVRDVLMSDDFGKVLAELLDFEIDHHAKMKRQAFIDWKYVGRTPFDSLMERGDMNMERIRDLYAWVISKELTGYSAQEREYIRQLGSQAYKVTVRRLRERQG